MKAQGRICPKVPQQISQQFRVQLFVRPIDRRLKFRIRIRIRVRISFVFIIFRIYFQQIFSIINNLRTSHVAPLTSPARGFAVRLLSRLPALQSERNSLICNGKAFKRFGCHAAAIITHNII